MKTQPADSWKEAAESVSRFQWEFYEQLRGPRNLVFSPLGLYFMLAMAHEGAQGETRAVLSDLLYSRRPEASLVPGLRVLHEELCSRTELTPAEKKAIPPPATTWEKALSLLSTVAEI